MRTNTTTSFLKCFLFSAAVALVGCPDTGDETGSATDTTGTTTTTTNPTDGTTTGGGAVDCATYCSSIMTNCAMANAQYASMESCMGACNAFPLGTAADTSGNTLGCRIYHAGAAGMDAATHCVHAGPGGAGACGANCDGFCSIATATCPTEHPDAATCSATCMGFMDTEPYDAADAAGNTLACRLYHLTVAATSATDAATHCPHTVAASPPCM